MTARLSLVCALLLSAVAASAQTADDLAIVDCRLPPKQKRIGGRTYPMASRPIRTTAVDCRIRGGEYTVYDRANYQTSLKIWLDAAAKGDHDAEYYVGKIYEDGLGTAPDYAEAAKWYEKASAAGHSASQFVLATMYERGLGVPADKQKALNLYRRAAGLAGDYVIVESSRYQELEEAAQNLELREEEVAELRRQLDDLRKQQKKNETRERELQDQLSKAEVLSHAHRENVLHFQGLLRGAVATAPPGPSPAFPTGALGRYYALVIGNAQYDHLPPVSSAERDANAVGALLRDDYGFQVTTLINAKNTAILKALYTLSQSLGENDNLVVYYAGHGKRDLRNRRGWWMPADAGTDPGAKSNWLPNQEVSDRLALIPAKHILVLADASYVGDITRGAPQGEPQNMTAAQWAKYVETTRQRRARLALSSGADEPSGASSRFTAALIDALKKQKGVVPASRVHRELVNALTSGESASSAVPTFAPLQSAFHDGVDFLFQRK
jgi:hypothetical protein